MDSDYLYVDDDLKLYKGDAAKARLATTNDMQFIEDGKGVVQVPKSRWQLAQRYEKRTWMEASSHATDDRNEEHAANFDDYEVLRDETFSRAIELGCGPFTNLRVLGKRLRIASCVLLDPLIQSYLGHRHCTYRHGKVVVEGSRINEVLGKSKFRRAIRRLIRVARPGALEQGIPIELLVASPIEEMPDCGKFDLVVMINVIEHCYDINTIFDKVLMLCRPGTVFIFHDRLFDADEVVDEVKSRFDAGHPLRVSGHLINNFLEENFIPLMEKRMEIADTVGDIDLTENGIYYIGKRR